MHMRGYQFDVQAVRERFPSIHIDFVEFASERSMVDAFFTELMSVSGPVVLTGFNFCHSIDRSSSGDTVCPKTFQGYDLSFMTARTSFAFTPKNMVVKIDGATTSFAS